MTHHTPLAQTLPPGVHSGNYCMRTQLVVWTGISDSGTRGRARWDMKERLHRGVCGLLLMELDFQGSLTRGPQCRMSILRNGNVPCCCFCNFHVDFKISECRLSNVKNGPCHVGIFSHVYRRHVIEMPVSPCRF